LLEDADCDGRSISMLQEIAGALSQKVEMSFVYFLFYFQEIKGNRQTSIKF
jgi:hypothetical protein